MSNLFATIDIQLVLLCLMAILFVVGVAGALRILLSRRDPILDRLQDVPGGADDRAIRRREAIVKSRPTVAAEEEVTTPTRVQQMLVHANISHPRGLQIFLTAKGLLAIGLPLLFLTINFRLTEPIDNGLAIALLLGVFGMFVPNIWLRARVNGRQRKISRSLPDALDLLVTCVEAGLGLDAALSRVATEVRVSAPELADELKTTFLEIGAGMQRALAFRRLAERTGLDDVHSLSATLAQTERFGTSIAHALRIRAEWMRTRRMQVAEEKAAVVSVKMTVPLVLCILPSLVAVIMGPAVVRIATQLLPFLGGGGE